MNRTKWIKEYKQRIGCQICCYNEHPEILEFHHLKRLSRRKNFNGITIPRKRIAEYTSLKKMRNAVYGKCLLLCPNCHKLIHRGISP